MTAERPHPSPEREDDHRHQLQIPNKSRNVSGKRPRLVTSRLQTSNLVPNSSQPLSHDALDESLSPRTAVSARLQFLNLNLQNPNHLQVANTMSPSRRKQQSWTVHPDSKTGAEYERQTSQAYRWSPSLVSHVSETPLPSSQGSDEILETQLTQDYDEGDTLIAAQLNGNYESQCEIFEFKAGSQNISRRRSWSNPQTPTISFHSDTSPAIADYDEPHHNKRVRLDSPSADHDDHEMLIELPSTPPDRFGCFQQQDGTYERSSIIPEAPSPEPELPHDPVAQLLARRHSPPARKLPSWQRYSPPSAPTPSDTKIADGDDRMDTSTSATASLSRSRSPSGRKLSSVSRAKRATSPVSAPGQQAITETGSTLWWREDELTGYNPSDPDDDGAGVNGVGYQKSAAEAWRIAQARKKQIEEWRVREQRDARAARRHARTGDGRNGGESKTEDGKTEDGRKVGEHRVMLGRVSKANSSAGSPVERRSPAQTLKGEKPERNVRFQVG